MSSSMSIPALDKIKPQPGIVIGRALGQAKRTTIALPDGSQVAPGEFPRLLVLAAGDEAKESGITPGQIAHFIPGSQGTMRAMINDQAVDLGIVDAGFVVVTSPGVGVAADEFEDFRTAPRRGPGAN